MVRRWILGGSRGDFCCAGGGGWDWGSIEGGDDLELGDKAVRLAVATSRNRAGFTPDPPPGSCEDCTPTG